MWVALFFEADADQDYQQHPEDEAASDVDDYPQGLVLEGGGHGLLRLEMMVIMEEGSDMGHW